MATDVEIREQRLRKQAELQSLNISLANLREREVSYITAQAAIPELLTTQIIEIRHKIEILENELFALKDESKATPAHRFYQEAFEAEVAQDFEKAIKLLKNAARRTHPDANAALRSLRYRLKTTKSKTAASTPPWLSKSNQPKHFPVGLIVALLIVALIAILALNSYLSNSPETLALDATATILSIPSLTPIFFANTATPTVTHTSTSTPRSTATNTPVPSTPVARAEVSLVSTQTPTAALTLKAAPKIVGPRNGLVWKDGAIVFEFEDMSLPDDELYCLDTLRGYDKTFTENWSFPPTGNIVPRIPIEANVFRIAELQEIRCIVWSAYIGQSSCDNVVSESSEQRVIGLPIPCDFR